ncbi:MAG: hypothetical protein J0I40_09205, partial [Cellulomonas sp.]|nr:hypothetical protein [Cellulomonas sp.]
AANATALARPSLGRRAWWAGMTALLGFPPFALFFSEVAIVLAGWRAGLGWAMGLTVALLLVVVAGLVRATASMVLGPAHDEERAASGPTPAAGHGSDRGPMTPLVLALSVTAVIGFVAVPVGDVLVRAAAALGLA